jgi:hypothetical protein
MFHLKLLINLAPLSIAGQIDWHAPKVTTIRSGALPKPGESSGSAPHGLYLTLTHVSWPSTRASRPRAWALLPTTTISEHAGGAGTNRPGLRAVARSFER